MMLFQELMMCLSNCSSLVFILYTTCLAAIPVIMDNSWVVLQVPWLSEEIRVIRKVALAACSCFFKRPDNVYHDNMVDAQPL